MTGGSVSVTLASGGGAGNFEAEIEESTAKKLEFVPSALALRAISAGEPSENFDSPGFAPCPASEAGAGVAVDAEAGALDADPRSFASLSLRLEAVAPGEGDGAAGDDDVTGEDDVAGDDEVAGDVDDTWLDNEEPTVPRPGP